MTIVLIIFTFTWNVNGLNSKDIKCLNVYKHKNKKQDSVIHCQQQTHFNLKDINKLRMKG